MSPMRTCPNGHRFNKTSDCPTCPECEKARAPKEGWLSRLSGPTRNALEHEGLADLKKLAKWSEKEVLALHGVGPASLPALRGALQEAGLSFRSGPAKKSAPEGKPTNTDEYLAGLPADQGKTLAQLRQRILAAAPGAEEYFGYGLPGFKYNGHPLVYFGAAKRHCGLYGHVPPEVLPLLKDFEVSKGTIRFTPEKPVPASIIKAMVAAQVKRIEERWPRTTEGHAKAQPRPRKGRGASGNGAKGK